MGQGNHELDRDHIDATWQIRWIELCGGDEGGLSPPLCSNLQLLITKRECAFLMNHVLQTPVSSIYNIHRLYTVPVNQSVYRIHQSIFRHKQRVNTQKTPKT